jgi:hypothetical protein
MRRVPTFPRVQGGVALLVGIIFLIVLSVVALMTMRGTLLEMRLTSNSARHEAAFEASEALRSVPVSLFDQHVFERGWPTSFGGTVPDADFTYSSTLAPSLLAQVKTALKTDCSGSVSLFYGSLQPACGTLPQETLYDPSTWHPDMVIAVCDKASQSCSANVSSTMAVVPDGTILRDGAGGAQSAGYRGLGVGAAGGGADMLFEINSIATAPGQGVSTTQTQYHQNIRN